MKKYLIYAGLVIAAMTSCQKEIIDGSRESIGDGIRYNLSVCENLLEGKSAFFAGEGVKLIGDENIAIFYDNSDIEGAKTEAFSKSLMGEDTEDYGRTPIVATGSGFNYSFTAPAKSANATKWYAIMPYARTLIQALDTETPQATVKIHSVQYPGANTFDPHYDYLAAEPFTFESTGDNTFNGKIEAFRRLTAPLRIVVSGLDATDKIYAASVKLSTEAGLDDGLTGVFKVKLDADPGKTGIYDNSAIGNGVTAIYPQGLAAENGVWNIWYCVNSTVLVGGDKLTVSVTTADKTYTREITLPSDTEINTGKISQIKVNAKGNGVAAEESVLYDFSAMSITTKKIGDVNNYFTSICGSDGITRDWALASASTMLNPSSNKDQSDLQYYDGGAGTPKALMLSAPNGTNKWARIPQIAGKKITKVGVYIHGACGNSVTVGVYESNAKETREPIASASFTSNSKYSKAGYNEIDGGGADLSGLYLQTTGTNELVAVKLYTEDTAETITDYYEAFEAGKDIIINGIAYNKINHSKYELLKVADITATSFSSTSDKIYFVDDSEQTSISIVGNINFAEGVVVIGRHVTSHPIIVDKPNPSATSPNSVYFRPKNTAVFKNITLESSTSGLFVTAASNTYCDITCEDCTLIYTGTGGVLRESSANKYFGDVIINNSVLQFSGPMLTCASAAAASIGLEKSIRITNSVFTPAEVSSTNANSVLAFYYNKDKMFEQTVDVIMENNTFYNFSIATTGIVSAYTIGSFVFGHNVIYTTSYKDIDNPRVIKTYYDQSFKPSPLSISYNWCSSDGTVLMAVTNSDSRKHWNTENHSKEFNDFPAVGNSFSKSNTAYPFTDAAVPAKGYLPINTGVVSVQGGAGADFKTKYWMLSE